MVGLLVASVLAYLLGAIPTAYIFGKQLKGIDIRQHGSGNVGATNAFRVLGKTVGVTVLVLDILKGVVATTLVPYFCGVDHLLALLLLSIIAVCGHNWTCFLNFSGGKGIATTLGVLIGLTVQLPFLRGVVGLTFAVWVLCFVVTRYVSLSSIVAAVALPIFMLIFQAPLPILILGLIFSVFVVYRHRANIDRLRQGTESKVPLFGRR